MRFKVFSLAALFVVAINAQSFAAGLPIPGGGPTILEFSSYAGAGFSPGGAGGTIDSDFIATTGMSDGDTTFGGTFLADDHARGASTGGVGTGGFYAFDVGSGSIAFGMQPTGGDMTPGTILIKLLNASGSTITDLKVTLDVAIFNNADRSSFLSVAHGAEEAGSFVDIPAMGFVTPETADTVPAWMVGPAGMATLTGLSIADGATYHILLTTDDVAGSGSRDEFGIVSMTFEAVPEPSSFLLCMFGAIVTAGVRFRRTKPRS